MKVLDFDTEPAWMRIHATEIMVINGKGWLEGRLQHYREKSNALFRPTGKELAEAPLAPVLWAVDLHRALDHSVLK